MMLFFRPGILWIAPESDREAAAAAARPMLRLALQFPTGISCIDELVSQFVPIVSHLVSHEGLLQVSEGGTVNEQRVAPSSVRTQQIAQSHLHAFIYLLLHNHELKGK